MSADFNLAGGAAQTVKDMNALAWATVAVLYKSPTEIARARRTLDANEAMVNRFVALTFELQPLAMGYHPGLTDAEARALLESMLEVLGR